ncbi:hypothetical protein [Vibrio owensii]|uniref:hypothetical protein n=1 Tax=Vibrio harveyi group TaxID=717610 RepID=UPI003CC62EEE
MGNLIIIIISLALIVVASIAAMYYGGSAFLSSTSDARVNAITNQITQIEGAITIYEGLGNNPNQDFLAQELIDSNLLKSLPSGWESNLSSISLTLEENEGFPEDLCLAVNDSLGHSFDPILDDVVPYSNDISKGIPKCGSDIVASRKSICCTDSIIEE